mmetsp:Transcript_19869/g.61498  ORF Transcript_19869/g.61498 Transcript_19869/m.61498 type:complete len:180 (+) Transcript_19869:57-596(+)
MASNVVPFGAAFPGMVISTLFFTFALVDYGVAFAAVKGNAALATAYHGAPLPVVGLVRKLLPLTTPGLVVAIVRGDLVHGLFTANAGLNHLLGLLQLVTVGIIYASIPKLVVPAVTAVNEDGMTPDEATELYAASGLMLLLNTIMLVAGVLKMHREALSVPDAPAPATTPTPRETKKSK